MSNNNDEKISLKRRSVCAGGLGPAAFGPLGLAGCGADGAAAGPQPGKGTVLHSMTTQVARTFIHPGLLHTEADFTRMRTKVAANAQPWLSGWNALISNGRAQLGSVSAP